MTSWIKMVNDDDANSDLQEALDVARTPHGTVDNVMRVHSLRPHTMHGHMKLYRAVLHDEGNTLPTWLQEVIGSYVSALNKCNYSFANHWKNAAYLIADEGRAGAIKNALQKRCLTDAFDGAELALLQYAETLTLTPGKMQETDVRALQDAGWDDGQILEANQIIGYFNYVNRCLNGLGVTTQGDVIGYYSN